MTVKEQFDIADGSRFQKQLYDLIGEKQLYTIIETGSGVSSVFILQAFDDFGIEGLLASIDPSPWYTHEIPHPRFEPIKQMSVDALINTFGLIGDFDLACSDGDHDVFAQTYEYEFMFACLKPNGYLVADDTTWGGHGAWDKFLQRHDLNDKVFGDARIVQKPEGYVSPLDMTAYHKQCLELAEEAESTFLNAGGKNSDIQWVRV